MTSLKDLQKDLFSLTEEELKQELIKIRKSRFIGKKKKEKSSVKAGPKKTPASKEEKKKLNLATIRQLVEVLRDSADS